MKRVAIKTDLKNCDNKNRENMLLGWYGAIRILIII